jgi:hypothetical protein
LGDVAATMQRRRRPMQPTGAFVCGVVCRSRASSSATSRRSIRCHACTQSVLQPPTLYRPPPLPSPHHPLPPHRRHHRPLRRAECKQARQALFPKAFTYGPLLFGTDI